MKTAYNQRGATLFESALGAAVALVIGVILVSNFKEAKGGLAQAQAAMAAADPGAYRALPQAGAGDKAEAVACDLRVDGSCAP
jgi:hypothetical protein